MGFMLVLSFVENKMYACGGPDYFRYSPGNLCAALELARVDDPPR